MSQKNPTPPEKSRQMSPQKQIVRAGGVLPPHPQSSARSLLIVPDFQRKKFELQVKTAAISRKIQNLQKMEKESQNVEGGAEFPPETPLPPRPHLCWRFWEFLKEKSTGNVRKKRGCGCEPDGYSPPFTFHF